MVSTTQATNTLIVSDGALPEDLKLGSLVKGSHHVIDDLAHIHDAPPHPFDHSVVVLTASHFDKTRWLAKLGLIKNVFSTKVTVLCRSTTDNTEEVRDALRSLGFVEHSAIDVGEYRFNAFSYDLNTYNRKREWNNPRYWANPENFHKHRW